MIIHLVRHGVKVKVPGDPPLSDIGLQQAKHTAAHLKKYPIDTILSSPFLRTRQTAGIISHALDLTFEVNSNLRERMNWENPNQPYTEFINEWIKATKNRDYQPKVGDSSRNAGMRVEVLINELVKNSTRKEIVLVTHGGIVSDFIRNVFSDEILNQSFTHFTDNLDAVIKECSITTVDLDNGRYQLKGLASIDHL